ncbi:IS200/IS605 family transposase [Micromonospora echinospora]|uniref:IS200/IS605 family transposase n=1 Tax=Micromonospora echinospora TaxID=1877 RepID=UPI000B5ADE48|nr:IS200/IS605 family transposase [Micromonospora echinospora]OZV73885.1 IS200/IS605 family transposase [Micromonospora echinospora]
MAAGPQAVGVTHRLGHTGHYRYRYHVVWCPKYRRKVIDGKVDDRLREIIREVCAERDAPIEAIETMPDHVHLLVVVDPQYGIHRLVKQIKGRSSRLLRQEFPHLKSRMPTLWTNSYFVATTGGAALEAIQRYVEDQRNV